MNGGPLLIFFVMSALATNPHFTRKMHSLEEFLNVAPDKSEIRWAIRMFLFGIDLNPDERSESVNRKLEYIKSLEFKGIDDGFLDPCEAMKFLLRDEISKSQIQNAGKIPVEYWLTSKPKFRDLVSVENYVFFVDSNGCKEYAVKVKDFVKNEVLPDSPIMIGVDHSSTGGALYALSQEFGPENLSVIVLDSHFDAILPTIRCNLVQYDLETNPDSKFGHSDPFIKNRSNSFNYDSFLFFLTKDRIILPENLVVFGVSDYPPPRARSIKDERVKDFLDAYFGLERQGVGIVTKKEINKRGIAASINPIFEKIKTPYVYVSLDIDVGATSALIGCRHLDVKGLSRKQILAIGRALNRTFSRKNIRLVGFDVMETDVYKAGQKKRNGKRDRTYEIESEFIRLLLDLLKT